MVEGNINIPVTVAMVRALALQADPGLAWPEWMMPGAMVFVVYNKGDMVTCPDCAGTRRLALANGGSVKCGCDRGQVWRSLWVYSKAPTKLLVGVRVFPDGGGKVEFAFPDMGYALSRIPLADIFPTLEAAQAAVRERNLILGVDNG